MESVLALVLQVLASAKKSWKFWELSGQHLLSTLHLLSLNLHKNFLTSSPQQYETLLSHEPRGGWRSRQLNSRRPAAWWPKTHTAVPHQFAAPEARVAWGAFLPLGLLSGQRDRLSQQESFQTLVPAIGNALTSFEPPADVSPAASAATRTAEPALFDDEWHSWSAVAAVRVEESAVGLPAPASPPQNQPRCLQAAQASYQPSALALKASPKTQIWVHNQFIGEVSGQVVAQKNCHQTQNPRPIWQVGSHSFAFAGRAELRGHQLSKRPLVPGG